MTTPWPPCAPPDRDNGRWLSVADGAQTVWVCLAHVRQIAFTHNGGEPVALLWAAGDLWEIADRPTVAALRAYVESRRLRPVMEE